MAGTPVVIVIDPGHGGISRVGGSSPNNAVSPSGELEKNWTLDLAKRTMAALLSKARAAGKNVKVFLTRETDINLGLSARANVARAKRAKLFLAIHFNGFNKTVRGVETLISTVNVNPAEDQQLAAAIQTSVLKAMREIDPATADLPNYDRTFGTGFKKQALGVLNDVALGNTASSHQCRACLVEIEFMDTDEVEKLFRISPEDSRREANREKVADQEFRYCGQLLWPEQRENYLPLSVGIAVDSSTEPHVNREAGKAGKVKICLSFKDMYSSSRFLQQAIELLIVQGRNHVCILAGTLESSAEGLPIEITPGATQNGKLVSGDATEQVPVQ